MAIVDQILFLEQNWVHSGNWKKEMLDPETSNTIMTYLELPVIL